MLGAKSVNYSAWKSVASAEGAGVDYNALEMNGVLYTVAGRGAFISPEKDQLSQFKKLAADRFAAAVQAATDAGLTRQELEQIVEEQMERRDRDD